MNQPISHVTLIATHQRAQADAAHKSALIKAAAKKGPSAIQAAVETAVKAVRRRDSYEKSWMIWAWHSAIEQGSRAA